MSRRKPWVFFISDRKKVMLNRVEKMFDTTFFSKFFVGTFLMENRRWGVHFLEIQTGPNRSELVRTGPNRSGFGPVRTGLDRFGSVRFLSKKMMTFQKKHLFVL